ncbi:MAG: glycosidase, partial [Candidatus Aenigmatarchaeota archaeon]
GDVPNVVFPEGAVVKDGKLLVYYGAADKRCCLATCELDDLLDFLLKKKS